MEHFNSFYQPLRERAQREFPSLAEVPAVSWDHLVSPYILDLPRSAYDKAEKAIRAFFQLSRRDSYRQLVGGSELRADVKNAAVLMAYDFHTTLSGNARLVEINTNAAGFALSAMMNSAHESVELDALKSLADLRASFVSEGMTPERVIAVVDDDIPNQKMRLEFMMFKDLFRKWGWNSILREAADFQYNKGLFADQTKVGFVYNRSTDFYLSEEPHAALCSAWRNGDAIVSPQPNEYILLADKERLVNFSTKDWLEQSGATADEISAIRDVLIPTFEKDHFETAKALWEQRRKLFFKPRRAFGGKSVYRGESVSRKVFDRLMAEDILIQEFVPASPVPGAGPGHPHENWKFDVRFYVYRDQIQQVVARLYQGQVTNFASPFGGFSRVRVV